MKKYIITFALATILLTGCSTSKKAALLEEHRNYVSWIAFCATRGHNYNDLSYSTTNEYLDTWCGSVEEEAAFIKAGVEPY